MPQVTISKVMLEHAALAVETARTQFRINLDFSATSLSEVDRILSALYFNRDRGLVAKLLNKNQEHELREQAKTWGGYVGETLRRKWGGTWHTTVLPGGEIQIYLTLFGSNAYPIDEVYKRLAHGPQQQSLLGLHEIALANANPAAMNAPKGHAGGAAPSVVAKPHATVAPAPTGASARPQMGESSVDIVRVGIIGFGRIGAEHAAWLAHSRDARAAAAFDVTPARRLIAEERGLVVHADIDGILGDRDIDAVLIATPTAMHHEHAYRALHAGKHVMIEKPMAMNLAQARDLHDTARREGKVLSVFHNRRWDSDYLTLKAAIDAGTFGDIINVESRIGQWASCVGPAAKEWRPGWRNEANYGGGGLYDWGSHFLDQVWRMMVGRGAKPVMVFAHLSGNVWSRDCDDFARVCIEFDSGAAAMVEINTTTTRPLPRWHVDGTLGSADSPYSLEFDLNEWSRLTFCAADNSAPTLLPRAQGGLSERQIWDQFAHAVRGKGSPAVTAASVLPTMALLEAARESARSGRAMDVSDVSWHL